MLFDEGLEGIYYIICVDEARDWWQLRKVDDHQVVSCGVGKEYVLKALKTQVERYKTTKELQKHWNSLSYTKPLREEVLAHRQLEYEVVKDISDSDLSEVFTVVKRPTLRRRFIKNVLPLEEEVKIEEEERPKLGTIRRRRLVKK